MSRRLVIDDGRAQRELLLIGTMVVGRDPACEITNGDPRLSRRHAEFRVTPDGVTVHDLQSRNGIKVNGQPVQEAVLRPGDQVQVAHLSLRFVDDQMAFSGQHRIALDGRSGAVAVASAPDDDRTVAAAPGRGAVASRAALTEPITIRPGLEDDRTRVASAPPTAPGPATLSTAPVTPVPTPVPPSATRTFTDVGDLTIRARPESPRADVGIDFGVKGLLKRPWGRRVLLQGVVLALIVFLATAVPLLTWHSRMVGHASPEALGMLMPPLFAAAFAGVVVSTLISRTTARGLKQDRERGQR